MSVSDPGSSTASSATSVWTSVVQRCRNLARAREIGIFLVLAALCVGTTIGNPRFLAHVNLRGMELDASSLAVLAIGETMVVITRSVDLSVGSVTGLAAYVSGKVLATHPGVPVVGVVFAAVLVGAVCGLLNGVLVAIGKVPALVATLGTLYVIRGFDYWWVGSHQIVSTQIPTRYTNIETGRLLAIPYPVYVAAAIVLIVGWYLRSFRSGRELYAMGSDPAAAVRAGIDVRRRLLFAFLCSGMLAGLAGALYTARYGAVDSGIGTGSELNVIAAMVVGGVAIFGGSGSAYGAAIGAMLLTAIGSSLGVLGVNPYWVQALVGVMIVGSIALDRLLITRLSSRLRALPT